MQRKSQYTWCREVTELGISSHHPLFPGVQDFVQGQELFTVPMRLALSEVWPKEDCEAACSAGLPHTRLAAKLLRQKALGSSSAWQPYIAVRRSN